MVIRDQMGHPVQYRPRQPIQQILVRVWFKSHFMVLYRGFRTNYVFPEQCYWLRIGSLNYYFGIFPNLAGNVHEALDPAVVHGVLFKELQVHLVLEVALPVVDVEGPVALRGDRPLPRDLDHRHPSRRHEKVVGGQPWARLCCIEIKARSNQVRDTFLALYLDWKTIFQVSILSFDTVTLTKDTLHGSLDTESVSWLWFASPNVLYGAQP